MLCRWLKPLLLCGLLVGLYLPAQANTNTPVAPSTATPEPRLVQTPGVEVSAVDLSSTQKIVTVALLLPSRSDTLREPAEVVRAGFQAGYEREHDGITVNIVETGDTAQDILSGYKKAVALNDIVVGPLSRTGVTVVAQSGAVTKPTIALTPPDTENADLRLPPHMLVMGLSIEEEARQIADWASEDSDQGKALVLFTKTPWQRRAAKAFEAQWLQLGLKAESVEIATNDGFLNGRALLQLKKQAESDKPTIVFLALDAQQARQVRAVVDKSIPLYGTSQLNPVALTDQTNAERDAEMDGTRLLDIPWQLQADHPAVMVYPRLVVNADQKRNADLERLYALGIDAYRVMREVAANHTNFQIDGVTGRLTVHFDNEGAEFERSAQQAIYRDGSVVAEGNGR